MRRRNQSVQASSGYSLDEETGVQSDQKQRQQKRQRRRSARGLIQAAVGHPLFGFVLFLILFPGRALLLSLQRHCLNGDLFGCGHNNPSPVLVRAAAFAPYLQNWRLDGRCGFQFPSPADEGSSICDPFSKLPCCSQWGWCGSGPEHCTQAVKAPYNLTGSAVEKSWVDLQQRITGKVDSFHSAYDDAFKPITANYSKIRAALDSAEVLTADQQDAVAQGVLIRHRNLERFTCCTKLPPFRISALGYWTQATQLPRDTAAFMQQLGFKQPDDESSTPSIWQRMFGMRGLLATMSVSQGTFHASSNHVLTQHPPHRQLSASSTAARSAQHDRPFSNTNETARPLLRRQNAFRLNERESQELSQQLGLTQRAHGRSGHELLAISDAAPDPDSQISALLYADTTSPTKDDKELHAALSDVKVTAKNRFATGLLAGRAAQAHQKRQDGHHAFNATAAFANMTRCNPQRWLHMHASGLDLGKPRHDASGKLILPPSNIQLSSLQPQPYPNPPLTLFQGSPADKEGPAPALVVYHYYESLTTCEEDEEIQVIRGNLLTFIRFAVRENDGVDYIISMGGRIDANLLDLIPGKCNVRVRFVDNSTMHSDTCSFQQALVELGPALMEKYKYYAVINNGMRGPFAAAGKGLEQQHWLQPFIDKIDKHVKLVGPYLSCEIAVHVQAPFLVLDRVGLRYLLDMWSGCWRNHQADIENGEIGLSQALLADGYNIASMQHEYAGLDFRRQPDRLQCKGRLGNPTFCCEVSDPLKLHWVKYGGLVYRLGLLPPPLLRLVEDLTERTLQLSAPLTPDSSRWGLPHADWVQQQNAAKQQADGGWWQALTAMLPFRTRTTSKGSVEQEPQTLVARVAAMLASVPAEVQQAANAFLCAKSSPEPSLMGWIADAAMKLHGDPIPVQEKTTGVRSVPIITVD